MLFRSAKQRRSVSRVPRSAEPPICRRRLNFGDGHRSVFRGLPKIKFLPTHETGSRKFFGLLIPLVAPWTFVLHHVIMAAAPLKLPQSLIEVIYYKM